MCVICGGSIGEGRATPSDGVAFDCPKHGTYAIARTAIHRFLKMNVQAQEGALGTAKLFATDRNNEVIITSMDL